MWGVWGVGKEKMKQDGTREGDKLLISGNKQGCWRGGRCKGWGAWVMNIGDGICYAECCELCKTDESQTCTPERNNALYVNLKKNTERW